MTDSIIQMQVTLNEKRNSFINWIEFNINDKKVLDAAINYFDYEEKVRKATLKLAQIDLAVTKSTESDNKNIDLVIAHYKIDSCFNKDESKKWLVAALKLVVLYNHTFDGIKFSNGSKNILKTEITK